MKRFTGNSASGPVVIDAILAPIEAGTCQFPPMAGDPFTQDLRRLRIALNQIQRESADTAERVLDAVQRVSGGGERLFAEDKAVVARERAQYIGGTDI